MSTVSDGPALAGSDILVTESAAGTLTETEGSKLSAGVPVMQQDAESLAVEDVLRGDATDPGLGAYLTLESIGDDTVVNIDSDASSGPVQLVTLHGVADVTLQQLLSIGDWVT